MHHRGHPGARHGARQAGAGQLQDPPDRAELPGHHHARRVQDRHHARPHPQARQDRHRLALGHADLRGGGADHRGGSGPDDLHRHRRRPGERDELRGQPGAVPEGPGDRGHHHDRRDRRRRRGQGRGVHPRLRDQEAGRRLHRRAHRASGPPHGPRRRGDLRRQRHRRLQDRVHEVRRHRRRRQPREPGFHHAQGLQGLIKQGRDPIFPPTAEGPAAPGFSPEIQGPSGAPRQAKKLSEGTGQTPEANICPLIWRRPRSCSARTPNMSRSCTRAS
ncbi:protein of unknown function [Azospirillum baldaniorum]|uniref:Uncharacterized protein n=1 Tax=Azospirillum baldaniorum TaxID=1064539 RepID=A0A9P1JTG1_9PROT|nr:protein of unknown function [Azospirillum baldaniorum]